MQEGVSPLHTASGCGNVSVAELLIARGADASLRDAVSECVCVCVCVIGVGSGCTVVGEGDME